MRSARYAQIGGAVAVADRRSPAHRGNDHRGEGGIQGLYSRYFGKNGDYLNETSRQGCRSTKRGTPYLDAAERQCAGRVGDAGARRIGSLAFGGNSALASDTHNWSLGDDQPDRLPDQRHPVAADEALPAIAVRASTTNRCRRIVSARFSFASLADLAANRPS